MYIQQVREIVGALLEEQGDTRPFGDKESLVLSRRLSSLQVVELATILEKRYGLDYAKIGFNQYDFDTVESIAALIISATQR